MEIIFQLLKSGVRIGRLLRQLWSKLWLEYSVFSKPNIFALHFIIEEDPYGVSHNLKTSNKNLSFILSLLLISLKGSHRCRCQLRVLIALLFQAFYQIPSSESYACDSSLR